MCQVPDTDDFYQRVILSDFGDPDDGCIADNGRHPGLTPACQTSLCDTRDELDTVDVDSLTGGFKGWFCRMKGISVIDQFPNSEKFGSVCHERFIPETIMRG